MMTAAHFLARVTLDSAVAVAALALPAAWVAHYTNGKDRQRNSLSIR